MVKTRTHDFYANLCHKFGTEVCAFVSHTTVLGEGADNIAAAAIEPAEPTSIDMRALGPGARAGLIPPRGFPIANLQIKIGHLP